MSHKKRSCPVTKRLAEDMTIRNMAPNTIDAYTYHVRCFANFIKKPLDRATAEDVRTFQLHLIQERKLAYSTFNQAVCALRFYYRHTQPTPWPVTAIPFGKRPKKLPTVLARQEVDALIRCTNNLKHRTFLMTLYAGGLRFAEAANLRIPDIDSKRMMMECPRNLVQGYEGRDWVTESHSLCRELRRCKSAQRAVGTSMIVRRSPLPDYLLRFGKRAERFAGQALVTKPAVEALDIAVLPGATWFNERCADINASKEIADAATDELWSVVTSDKCRNASNCKHIH